MKRYPPYGYLQSVDPHSYMPSNYAGGRTSASLIQSMKGGPNQFQEHAKKGFKYWHEENIPMAGMANGAQSFLS